MAAVTRPAARADVVCRRYTGTTAGYLHWSTTASLQPGPHPTETLSNYEYMLLL